MALEAAVHIALPTAAPPNTGELTFGEVQKLISASKWGHFAPNYFRRLCAQIKVKRNGQFPTDWHRVESGSLWDDHEAAIRPLWTTYDELGFGTYAHRLAQLALEDYCVSIDEPHFDTLLRLGLIGSDGAASKEFKTQWASKRAAMLQAVELDELTKRGDDASAFLEAAAAAATEALALPELAPGTPDTWSEA